MRAESVRIVCILAAALQLLQQGVFDASGTAHGVFALAKAPTAGGSDCATATPHCDQAIYTTASGLSAAAEVSVPAPVDSRPLPDAASDHAAPKAHSHRR